jgi:polar amino acid transport system substrate-binding protein
MKGKKLNKIVLILFILLSSMTCADDPNSTDDNGLEKISVQLLWLHQFQFAGYYMAKEKGFYKNSGLDVELKEFKYGMNVTDEVIDGKSNFGIGRSSLIIERIQNKPITILGATFQKSPHILLSKKSSNINTVSDLKNKRIMITSDLIASASIVAMLASKGIPLKDINKQEHTFDLNDLIEENTDIMGAYVSNEPYQLKEKGIEYHILDPADYGFDLYGDLLFTSKEELSRYPNRVEAFYKATLKGWQYAFSHIKETAKLIHTKYNTQNKSLDALLYEGRVLKKYAYVDNIKLGHVDINKVRRIADIYLILGLIEKEGMIDDILYTDFKDNAKLKFTQKELNWIEDHPVIKVAAHENYKPFEYIDTTEHKGMVPAYLDILEKKIGVRFHVEKSYSCLQIKKKINSKDVDMVGMSISRADQTQYVNYTKPYLSFPVSIITRDNVSYLHGPRQLKDKKVVVTEGSITQELLSGKYPQMDFVGVPTIDEGLKMVSYGDAFAFLENIATSSHYIKENGLSNLKVSGDMGYHLELAMAVRKDWPEFTSILQKTMDSITEKEKDQIYSQWVFFNHEQEMDYYLVIKIIAGSIVLLLIPIVWVILLRNQIIKRKKVEKELKEAVKKTTKLSLTDTLTGISNRLYIDQFLEEEIQRSQRYGNNLSIILIDIDNFKHVNDQYGHIIGDKVLIDMAGIISPMIRKTDVFGRWGGEEFLIICTETDLNTAVEIAEGIRTKIDAYDFKAVGSKTVSMGVTAFIPNDTMGSIISRADKALYRAKKNGKNRVVSNEATE